MGWVPFKLLVLVLFGSHKLAMIRGRPEDGKGYAYSGNISTVASGFCSKGALALNCVFHAC